MNSASSKAEVELSRWKRATLVSSIVAVLALIWPLLKAYDWFTKPTDPRFAIVAVNNAFILPPEDHLRELGAGVNEYPQQLKDASGLLILDITNTGDSEATNVEIDANDSGFALSIFDDGRSDFVKFSRRFSVGTLRSNENVKVCIWGNDNSFFDDAGPRILIDGNQTPIALTSSLAKFKPLLLLVVAICICGICLQLYAIFQFKRGRAQVETARAVLQRSRDEWDEIQARIDSQVASLKTAVDEQTAVLQALKDENPPHS